MVQLKCRDRIYPLTWCRYSRGEGRTWC